MCIAPNKLADGTLIGCHDCWQCRERKVLDWAGRCIAESRTSTASSFITLTYGKALTNEEYGLDGLNANEGRSDHERAAVLTYSDVQKFFKRLRKAGFPLSYFVVGEYGSLKGRAHWHAIVYWHGKVPKHELRNAKYEFPHWIHGFSYWDRVTPSTVRYLCKYVLKDVNDAEAQGHLAMSKKPPLGARWFAQRAQTYVAAGLAPQTLAYTFHDAVDSQGKKLKFLLSGRSAELFLEEYVRRWRGYPDKGFQGPPCPVRGWHYPPSDLVEEFEDRQTRKRPLSDDELNAIILDKVWRPPACEEIVKIQLEDNSRPLDRAQQYATRMQREWEIELARTN